MEPTEQEGREKERTGSKGSNESIEGRQDGRKEANVDTPNHHTHSLFVIYKNGFLYVLTTLF